MQQVKLEDFNEVQKEFFEERAGIKEYEANMPRVLAEEQAFEETLAFFNLK